MHAYARNREGTQGAPMSVFGPRDTHFEKATTRMQWRVQGCRVHAATSGRRVRRDGGDWRGHPAAQPRAATPNESISWLAKRRRAAAATSRIGGSRIRGSSRCAGIANGMNGMNALPTLRGEPSQRYSHELRPAAIWQSTASRRCARALKLALRTRFHSVLASLRTFTPRLMSLRGRVS
jgi:hypothetical protein